MMTRRGYHGTGVLEIVQAAGIPKGSYAFFMGVGAMIELWNPRTLLDHPTISDQIKAKQNSGSIVFARRSSSVSEIGSSTSSLGAAAAATSASVGWGLSLWRPRRQATMCSHHEFVTYRGLRSAVDYFLVL